MNAVWIWAGALVAYGAFAFWYHSWKGPLGPEEVETYLERFGASVEQPDPVRLAAARAFLESDGGGEFFMLNLIRMQPEPVAVPGSAEPRPARELLERYTGHLMPRLFLRAGHPVFVGPAAGSYLDAWGVEPDPGWSFAGVIRYRSRRDLMILASDPRFAPAHAFKVAAMANTLAFPVAPAWLFVGPRVWVALVLALLAALAHLALGGAGYVAWPN